MVNLSLGSMVELTEDEFIGHVKPVYMAYII